MCDRSYSTCATLAAFVAATLSVASTANAAECASTAMPADPPGVKTHAKIEKIGTRYRATLDIETTRSRGERVLEADSCDALARSTAVVLAMAAAPDRDDGSRDGEAKKDEPRPASPPPPSTTTIEAPKADRDSTPEKPQDEAPSVTLRAEAIADSSLLPAFAFGGGVALGVRATDKLRFEARAAMFAGQEERAFDDRGARFSLASGGARACYALTRTFEIAPCIGLDVSAVSATGFGARSVADGTAWVVSPEGLLAFRAPLGGPISMLAAAGVLAPLSRESFVITGRGAVHEIPAIAVRGFLGPEVRF